MSAVDATGYDDSNIGSDDDVLGEVGFMFDRSLPKARRVFCFAQDITVPVLIVEDDPGAVQSGHYVWPAAPALCSYLIHYWQHLPHGRVLELGAGCGLPGLVAARLPGTTTVVFTDHDPGVIDLIRKSIAEQAEANSDVGRKGERAGGAWVAPAVAIRLSWGPLGQIEQASLIDGIAEFDNRPCAENCSADAGALGDISKDGDGKVRFDLVIASDVIYSVVVVEPLFHTVDGLLARAVEKTTGRRGDAAHGRHNTGTPEPQQRGGKSPEFVSDTVSTAVTPPARPKTGENVDAAEGVTTATEGLPLSKPSYDPTTEGYCSDKSAYMSPDSATTQSSDASPHHLASCKKFSNAALRRAASVFAMSQSFVYDPQTEKAIEQACKRHGLLREVVWDELPRGDANRTSTGTSRTIHDASEDDRLKSKCGVVEHGLRVQLTESHRGCGKGDGGTLSRERDCRVIQKEGTKLQLFWRG